VGCVAVNLAPTVRGQVFDPAGCAYAVVSGIDFVVNAAYDIVQAAADCTLPGLDELACASDLSDMLSYWFNLGSQISRMTFVCGSLDNVCAATILQAFGDISDTSNALVASASDCVSDPFICTFDVVSAIDDMNNFVLDLIGALQGCNGGPIPFYGINGYQWDLNLEFPANGGTTGGDGGYFERRLSEKASGDNATDAGKDPKAAQFMEAYAEFRSKVQEIHAIAVRLRKSAPPSAKQVAFDKLHSADAASAKLAAYEQLVKAFHSQRGGETVAPPSVLV